MPSTHTKKTGGPQILQCQVCGKECTPMEFIHVLNLCDHLALDAVAFKTTREQSSLPLFFPSGIIPQKEEDVYCPRCQGLMRTENFWDLEINAKFQGWRCLSCGNVWDPIICANRMPVEKPHVPPKLGAQVRKEALSVHVRQGCKAPGRNS